MVWNTLVRTMQNCIRCVRKNLRISNVCTSSSLFDSDHTCSMGNPLFGDDQGLMCFNAAKNWYASLSYLET